MAEFKITHQINIIIHQINTVKIIQDAFNQKLIHE
ncbi:MAG: hypothetical protein RL751_1934 [Bacteroidota bacterium]